MGKRALTIVEYMALIAILAASLIGMQVHFKRALQGKIRSTLEEFSGGMGYSPGATMSDSVITRKTDEITESYTERDANDEKMNISIVRSPDGVPLSQVGDKREEVLSSSEEPKRF